MSTSNRKSSSSGSRPSARGLVATPRTSSKQNNSRAAAARGKGAKTKRSRGLETPKASSAKVSPRVMAAGSAGRVSSARGGEVSASAARNAGRSGATARTRERNAGGSTVARRVAIGAAIVALLALIALIALLVLSQLPVFVIEGIDATASEHVSAETIAKLAAVDEGTTLLSVDPDEVAENVKKNPWVKNVSISREFPSTLKVTVEERTVSAIVICGSGMSVWSLGDDGHWIEPTQLDSSTGDDVTTQALAKAEELGVLLITNVPGTVNPAQGSACTDDSIQDVLTYQQQLPESIRTQAQVYYAASSGSISLVLKNGLEISLGAANDISAKATALTEIMGTYGDQLTYVNVRVPSKPTYRKVADGATLSGAAATVAQIQQEAAASTEAATTEAASDDSEGSDSSDSSNYSSDGEGYDESYDYSEEGYSE